MSPKKDTQKSRKSSTASNKKFTGFTDEERAAMKEYVQEKKTSEGRGPRADKADGESAVLAKIAEMRSRIVPWPSGFMRSSKPTRQPSRAEPGTRCVRIPSTARSSASSNRRR